MPPSDRTDISGDSDEFREERDFMPDVDCTLRCYLRVSPPAVDPHAAQRMVDQLAAQGYYVAAIEEQEVDIAWYCAFFLAENVAGEPDPTARFASRPPSQTPCDSASRRSPSNRTSSASPPTRPARRMIWTK